jgi:hypothetical protein
LLRALKILSRAPQLPADCAETSGANPAPKAASPAAQTINFRVDICFPSRTAQRMST